ncbi:DUF2931 family protein [Escherichia coli]|nr:DUF2931 family protein [Escherichia coli]
MKITAKIIYRLTIALMIAGSVQTAAKEKISLLAPYDEWYFNFFYPDSLPAEVTYVELLDTDGIYYQFRTLASTNASPGSVGQWSEKVSGMSSVFTVIDKKVYETWITLAGDVWKLMLTPYSPPGGGSEKYYLRYLLIGLAPEGKVRVWLNKRDKPNIRLTDKQILIETVSGEKMEMCNGRSAYKHGYSYPESTKNFIKDKKYPYGNW